MFTNGTQRLFSLYALKTASSSAQIHAASNIKSESSIRLTLAEPSTSHIAIQEPTRDCTRLHNHKRFQYNRG